MVRYGPNRNDYGGISVSVCTFRDLLFYVCHYLFSKHSIPVPIPSFHISLFHSLLISPLIEPCDCNSFCMQLNESFINTRRIMRMKARVLHAGFG